LEEERGKFLSLCKIKKPYIEGNNGQDHLALSQEEIDAILQKPNGAERLIQLMAPTLSAFALTSAQGTMSLLPFRASSQLLSFKPIRALRCHFHCRSRYHSRSRYHCCRSRCHCHCHCHCPHFGCEEAEDQHPFQHPFPH